jgi:hypothetical protein
VTKHAELDDFGTLAGTALTTSFQDLILLTEDVATGFVFNSTDVTVILSIPSDFLLAQVLDLTRFQIP